MEGRGKIRNHLFEPVVMVYLGNQEPPFRARGEPNPMENLGTTIPSPRDGNPMGNQPKLARCTSRLQV